MIFIVPKMVLFFVFLFFNFVVCFVFPQHMAFR